MEAEKMVVLKNYEGVFIVFHRKNQEDYILLNEVQDMLVKEGIKDIDFNAIFEAVNNKLLDFTIKVSDEKSEIDVSTLIHISVRNNKQKAYVKLSTPFMEYCSDVKGTIKKAILDSGISFGVKEDVIDAIAQSGTHNREYLIATGLEPRNGKDGYIEYNFDTSPKSLVPKERDDGTVDYFNLNLVKQTAKGTILVRGHEPTHGALGKNIYGEDIPFVEGQKMPNMPTGKGIKLIKEESIIVADESGQIEYKERDKKININHILEVQGISYATGNIKFDGTVVVQGNVDYGMKVEAKGDIEVHGIVEGATIISEGNITLIKGCMGRRKALIKCKKNLKAKFLDGCTAEVDGSILSNSIMHSEVVCNDKIILDGKNALLVGGKIYVKNYIEARVVGSHLATTTEIEIGNIPSVMQEFKDLLKKRKDSAERIENIEKIIKALSSIENLPEDKRRILAKTFSSKVILKTEMSDLDKKIAVLEADINVEDGRLKVRETIYTAVRITIGNATKLVSEEMNNVVMENKDGKVVVYNM
ncbi:MAG: DUF342 domain-containing protein [Lachnospirales bacterium]